jgi:hypothetical protein
VEESHVAMVTFYTTGRNRVEEGHVDMVTFYTTGTGCKRVMLTWLLYTLQEQGGRESWLPSTLQEQGGRESC